MIEIDKRAIEPVLYSKMDVFADKSMPIAVTLTTLLVALAVALSL